MYLFFKQIIDFILALLLSPILLPVLIIFGIAIKMEDGGSLFYKAKRIGKNGKIFKMYKFRSMKENSPDIRLEDGSTYNSEDDERVTKIGKFMRKKSIDELPQLINILIGDMSFIGPRPDSAMYLDQYTTEERIILTVKPGVTGYNQAVNRNAVLTKEKLKNDILYVKNISFIFDLKIIFLTLKTVVCSNNINRVS